MTLSITTITRPITIGLLLLAAAKSPLAVAQDDNNDGGARIREQGSRLYQSRCATCHDNATDRTPSRAVLSANTPAFIYAAIDNGPMAPMAEGLSTTEKQSIALYIAPDIGRLGTAGDPDAHTIWGPPSTEMPLEGPLCAKEPVPVDLSAPQWNGWSIKPDNARYQPTPGFKVDDIPKLKVKWAFHYRGSKNGQATIIGQRLFVTSMSGAVYALDAASGCVHWRHDAGYPTRSSVSLGPGPENSTSKTLLYFSDWSKSAVALDADTGKQVWKTKVEDTTGVQMTGSPTLYNNILLVPISTGNEAFATNDNYICCKFIGSLVALNAHTGEVIWKTYTTDQKNEVFGLNRNGQQMWGPAGGSIWSAPTVDPDTNIVYVSTSNSHTEVPHHGSNSVIAIDLLTGKKLWTRQLLANDAFIIGCPKAANCPKEVGPDFALGASPILRKLSDGRKLLLAGQKSGHLHALDPDNNGNIIWQQRLSRGSALGGVEFGPAADEDNVYVGISDVIVRQGANPSVSALRIRDGKLLWQMKSPQVTCRWQGQFCHGAISQALTVVPGAVFAGAMNGHFRAYSTSTGEVLWDYDTATDPHITVLGKPAYGGVMDAAGPTIVNGMVYVHSGYAGRSSDRRNDLSGVDGNLLLAFSVDGK